MSKFLSNVIKLFSATLVGQILGIVCTPILSRLYSPSDFGMYQIVISMVSLIASIACFSYYSAILLPKKDEDAGNIVVLCLILIIFTSVATTIFFFIFSGYIEQTLNAPGFSNYIFLILLGIIFNSIAYVLNYWLTRKEEFGIKAKSSIYSSISGKGVSIGFGILSPSPFGLIFGTIINDATIVLVLGKKTIADYHFFQEVSYEKIKHLAYRYKNFPIYGVGSDLAASATIQATPFILAFFFSPVIVGYYSMAYFVVRAPLRVIGYAIESAFLQKASLEKNLTGGVKNIVKSVYPRLISIGMFACLILLIIGQELFTFVLGAQWSTAGIYAQIFAPWFFVAFISLPLITIFNILEKQSVSLWFNILLLISNIIVLIIGGLLGDPILGMLLISGTGVFFWTWMDLHLLKIAGISVRDAVYELMHFLSLGVVVSIPLLIAKYYSLSSSLLIVVAIIVSIIYYTIIGYQDIKLREGIIYSIKNMFQK